MKKEILSWIANNPESLDWYAEWKIKYGQLIKMVGKLQAFRWAITKVDYINEEVSTNAKVQYSCKKGCSFCCHHDIPTYTEEVAIIVEYCRKHNIAIDKNHLLRQNKLSINKLLHSDVSACVFLKDNECTIYEARPIICRSYHVISPPELCDIKNNKEAIPAITAFNLYREAFMGAITSFHKEGRLHQMILPYAK